MEINVYIFFITAIIPMFIGFIWFGPLFGKAWMSQVGFRRESYKSANLLKTLILSYAFGLLIAFYLQYIVIHQMGIFQTLINEPGFNEQTEAYAYFNDFIRNYGDRFRTFSHGIIHGAMTGIIFVLPILSIIALLEKKSFKYVAINASYWIVTLAIMGGIICEWL